MSTPHYVYAIDDPKGAVLYIGSTKNMSRRMVNHLSSGQFDNIAIQIRAIMQFDDKSEALKEERRLIREVKPPFNTNGVKDQKKRKLVSIDGDLHHVFKFLAASNGVSLSDEIDTALSGHIERRSGASKILQGTTR